MKFLQLKATLILILSIIFSFAINSCKRDDEGKTYGPYTLGDGKDYVYFKPGSWWVYKNNKSGLCDTFILKSIYISLREFKGKNTVIKEVMNMFIYSKTTKYEYRYYTFGANPDAKPEILASSNFISLILGKSKAGDYQGECIPFYYPFDSTRVRGMGSNNTYHKSCDSVMTLNGKNFHMIKKFFIDHDPTWESWPVNWYWAKNVGLIKWENVKKGESWDLVSYFVEKQ